MMKTLTMRVDDSVYQMIKIAAEGQKRNISNFIEFATLQYLTSVQYVDNSEMNEILNDRELLQNLQNGLKDLKARDYKIV
ncbi:MAG: CopG family transcriptional regulator [Desulfobacula sp.]|nr:CopG family transcriptional regulator [Desulfobacula sp.]MBT3484615.1 CopG family transcriptional regulator [Desulfobacula sp.]MBT3803985.1 CopG family transcriptional regulator [Desulfobacula sp.]MBT4023600.1 CopG family transcriptional regulator [Desulfobacula sp.]MBT4197732.1 CopG family transcriptional regulator [Desulfobacula sp.]